MAKTIVEFTLPFVVVDEGEYEVPKDGKVARIKVTPMHNRGGMETVMGLTSVGRATMGQDLHGVMNVSNITVELPYILEAFEGRADGKEVDLIKSKSAPLKKECLSYLNRLIDVVRWNTRQFWITPVAPRDILFWKCETVDDSGKRGEEMMMDFGQGIDYPISGKAQSDVSNEIVRMLANEEAIPLADSLYLDAVNYFEAGRFNEVVIVINVALETLVAGYLFVKLIRKGVRDVDAIKKVSDMFSDKFHKVMKKHFRDVDGRSLDDDKELWKKFNDARSMRKHALHPYTKKLSEEEARQTMDDILAVMNWVMRGM